MHESNRSVAASVQPLPSWLMWLAGQTTPHVRGCDADIGGCIDAECDTERTERIHMEV
jgi:hypothetical protein